MNTHPSVECARNATRLMKPRDVYSPHLRVWPTRISQRSACQQKLISRQKTRNIT